MPGIILPRENLPSDPPSAGGEGRGWFCEEAYSGAEVFRIVDGLLGDVPITERDALKVGDEVACPSMFGYFKATIEKVDDGLMASDGRQAGWLTFGKDDRKCWTCAGTMNIAAVRRVAAKENP